MKPKSQTSKVQLILALKLPTNVKDLCRFLGMVQYYRDLCAKCSEMLSPLTHLVGKWVTKAKGTKKLPWHWDDVHQKKCSMQSRLHCQTVVLAYSDHNKVFEYIDASATQLGAIITQSNRPLAVFSRKLTETQLKYWVTKTELPAIVETLNEFNKVLWGQKIVVLLTPRFSSRMV